MSLPLFADTLPALLALAPDGLAPSGDPASGLPVLILLGLGAVHGINPGMGWLFAVALGLQRREGRAVWTALPPLAVGHALAILAALAVAALVGAVIPLSGLKWIVAGLLCGYGGYRLVRTRHPRYGGMLMGVRELGVWSFLMASAHGAGLMVVPFLLSDGAFGVSSGGGATAGDMAHRTAMAGHGAHGAALAGFPAGPGAAVAASAIHSLGYLLVTALLAAVVYRWLGLRLLRTHWVNLDLVWSVALILTGLVTPWL